MITPGSSFHHRTMLSEGASERAIPTAGGPTAPPTGVCDARVRAMFEAHFDFIWRALRRFGLSEDRADDAAQQVFVVASRRLDDIEQGRERSFLFGTALRVASDARKAAAHRREIPHEEPGRELEGGPRPDDLVEQRRARALLDDVLDAMDLELRAVFVLFEIEEMTTAEIAEALAIPHGTVASRLRRAREEFRIGVERFRRAPKGPAGGSR
jgi:RNA polymerase sigma-70 factor (ECF subfamily)